MSAPSLPFGRPFERPRLAELVTLRPAEGWSTVFLTVLIALPFAWSLQDAGWIPGSEGSTGYLTWLAIASTVVGIVAAKAGWNRWKAHLAGAMIAGFILPLLAGGIVLGDRVSGFDLASLSLRFHAAGAAAFQAWLDLAIDGRPFTSEYAHYHIAFGALVWATGQFAGYAVFGHRRPFDAVLVGGLALLANMAMTRNDQLQILIAFSLAALLLLIRSHAFDEQVTWARRQIGDPATVSGLYLRGGATFVAIAIVGALVLTATASSAPLRDWWTDLPARLSGIADVIKKLAPPGGDPRGLGGVGFGATATTNGLWAPNDRIAFRAQLPANESRHFKWRAGTYAIYSGAATWTWGPAKGTQLNPRAPLLAGSGDDPARTVGRREVRAQIIPDAFRDQTILSPQTIEWVDQPATAQLVGTNGWFTSIESDAAPGGYVVTALIPVFGDVPGGLTENRLRAAGTSYPTDVTQLYTTFPDGSVGPNAQALLDRVRSLVQTPPGAPPGNPYDLAVTMQDYLRDPANFTYATDVRDAVHSRCDGISSVECFAIIKTGYCEYYASTMAILLRKAGIPTRVVYGFLSGERAPDGTEVVPAGAAHWWVEVYFPGYGWVEFDPTGGPAGHPVGQPLAIPSGDPVTSTPGPSGFVTPGPNDETDVPGRSPGAISGATRPGGGAGPFIVIAVLLLIGVGALMLAARRRGSRRPMDPEHAWGSLARFAGRFGFGPRPAQTVFEYAGALGDELPTARIELSTVARAKVEVAYGRRQLSVDRMRTIGEAYRRLRFAILKLAFRRRRRPRRNR